MATLRRIVLGLALACLVSTTSLAGTVIVRPQAHPLAPTAGGACSDTVYGGSWVCVEETGECFSCDSSLWVMRLNATTTDVHLVTSYGAACDGSTDDATALQAAIDAAVASDHGTVLIPQGSGGACCKTLTGLTVSGADSTSITGNGTICADGAITALTLDDTNKVEIDGITLEHLDGDAGSIGLYVTSSWTANIHDIKVIGFNHGIELDNTNASRNQHEIDLTHVEVDCGVSANEARCNVANSVGIDVESPDNFIGGNTYVRGYDIGILHAGNETIYEGNHIYRWPSLTLQMDACIKVTGNGASISGLHTGSCWGDPAGTGGGVWIQASEVSVTDSIFTWAGYCSTATTEKCTADYDAACPGSETCCSTPADTCEAAPSIYLDSSVVGSGTGIWNVAISNNQFDYSRLCANGGTCSSGVPGTIPVKVDSVTDWEDNSRFNFIYGNTYSGVAAAERANLIIRQPTAEQEVRFCAVGGTGEQSANCTLRFQRRSVTDAILMWDETDDEFEFQNNLRVYNGASGATDPGADVYIEDDGNAYLGIQAPDAFAAGVWFNHPALSGANQIRSTTSSVQLWYDGVQEFRVNNGKAIFSDGTDVDFMLEVDTTGAHPSVMWDDSEDSFDLNYAGVQRFAFGDGFMTADFDRDTFIDWVFCGDSDQDGGLDDVDIDTCIDLCTDSGCTVELSAGEYDLDSNQSLTGDTGCSNPRDPHVCLPSNTWLKGQGMDVTILKIPAYNLDASCIGVDNPYSCCEATVPTSHCDETQGDAPFIGWDQDGDTDVLPTTRVSNIHVSDMTLDGRGNCDPDSQLAQGIQSGDCDGCVVERVKIKNTSHAAVFVNRNTNFVGRDLYAENVGGYDTDGSGSTCVPFNSQPAFYHYNSTGIRSKDNIYENVYVDGVGGPGGQIRVRSWIQRDAPFGESDIDFDTDAESICQVFTAGDGTYGSKISDAFVRLRWDGGSEPTGTITFEIQETSAGAPVGTAFGGYSFETLDADEVLNDYYYYRFVNTDADPDLLTDATQYAACVIYNNAATQQNIISLEGDATVTDTYTGGDVYFYNGSAWAAQTGIDLNFALAEGLHERVGFDGLHVKDVSGSAGNGSQCANMRAGAISPFFRNITCEDTGPINLAQNNLVVNGAISNFDFRDAFGSASNGQGFRIGYWWDGVIEGGNIANTSTSGSPCIEIVDWTRGVSLNEVNATGCGSYGIRVGGGTRNIRMTDVHIKGTEAEGMYFANVTDSDGVSGAPDGVSFTRGSIGGTGLECIGLDVNNSISNVRISGNDFIRCGLNVLEFGANATATTGTVVIDNLEFSNNYSEDWGNNVTGTSANSIAFDIRPTNGASGSTTATGIVISNNVWRGKDRPIYMTYTSGTFDQVAIVGNLNLGTDTGNFITFTGPSGMDAVILGNMATNSTLQLADTNMQARRMDFPSGEMRWGPGGADPDVTVGRVAAGVFGTLDSGDGLGLSNGANWTSGSGAVSGGCTDGSLYTRTGATAPGLYVCENGTWSTAK